MEAYGTSSSSSASSSSMETSSRSSLSFCGGWVSWVFWLDWSYTLYHIISCHVPCVWDMRMIHMYMYNVTEQIVKSINNKEEEKKKNVHSSPEATPPEPTRAGAAD